LDQSGWKLLPTRVILTQVLAVLADGENLRLSRTGVDMKAM
jgi:hypothetical protein